MTTFASIQLEPYFRGGTDETTLANGILQSRSAARKGAETGEFNAVRGGIQGLMSAKKGEMMADLIKSGAPPAGSGAMQGAMGALDTLAPALGGLFGGGTGASMYGFDPIGSQGNPMFPSDIAPGSFPGGPAMGGGRIPLNG